MAVADALHESNRSLRSLAERQQQEIDKLARQLARERRELARRTDQLQLAGDHIRAYPEAASEYFL